MIFLNSYKFWMGMFVAFLVVGITSYINPVTSSIEDKGKTLALFIMAIITLIISLYHLGKHEELMQEMRKSKRDTCQGAM